MKKVVLLLALTLPLLAQNGPTLTHDGDQVPLSDPSIGAPIIIHPGWDYIVAFEDQIFLGDRDFNDNCYHVHVAETARAGLYHVTITPLGGITDYQDTNLTPTQLDLPAGVELVLYIYVHESNMVYLTGPASRNSDNQPHAWVLGTGPDFTGEAGDTEEVYVKLPGRMRGTVVRGGRSK